jgi:hypothetical protein
MIGGWRKLRQELHNLKLIITWNQNDQAKAYGMNRRNEESVEIS